MALLDELKAAEAATVEEWAKGFAPAGHRHDASEIDNLPTPEPTPDPIPGPANVLSIGTVTTGAPGTPASAQITGEAPAQVLNLTIPQGAAGAKGQDAPPAMGGSALAPGIMQVDSFPGASDGEKMANAIAHVAAQTYGPVLQLPARRFDTGSRSFAVPTGLKIIGAGAIPGPKNSEQGTRNVAGEWRTSCGQDAASLFIITGNVFGFTLAGIAFQGGAGSQLAHTGTGGNCYSAEFNSLTIYGFKHAFGSANTKFLNTFCHFTGIWTAVALGGTGFHFGGSDSFFWVAGGINLGAHQGSDGGGAPLIHFNGQSKSFAANIYATADQNFRPMRVSGSGDMTIRDCVLEGYKDNDPTRGSALRIEGGHIKVRDVRIAYAMRVPLTSEHGVIEVTGGNVVIDAPVYDRGTTPDTVPLVYVSGGRAVVRDVMAFSGVGGPTFTPRVQRVGGTVSADSSVAVV